MLQFDLAQGTALLICAILKLREIPCSRVERSKAHETRYRIEFRVRRHARSGER